MTVKSAAVPARDCLTCSRSGVHWVAKATGKCGRASLNHPGSGSAANNPGQYLFAAELFVLRAVVLACVTVTRLVARRVRQKVWLTAVITHVPQLHAMKGVVVAGSICLRGR